MFLSLAKAWGKKETTIRVKRVWFIQYCGIINGDLHVHFLFLFFSWELWKVAGRACLELQHFEKEDYFHRVR